MKIYKVKVNGKYYEVEVSAVEQVSGEVKLQPQNRKKLFHRGIMLFWLLLPVKFWM